MRRSLPLFAVLLLVVGCGGPTPDTAKPSGEVEFKSVTVKELNEFVASQKGKVVLFDCWFFGCAPCKKKFPEFVKLHQKYAEQGLVCVSLNVEQDDWKENRKECEAFLKEKGATFANFVFQDAKVTVSDWQDKYDANATPSYVAWDRAGKPVKMPGLADQAKPEFMEKFVADLLAEK